MSFYSYNIHSIFNSKLVSWWSVEDNYDSNKKYQCALVLAGNLDLRQYERDSFYKEELIPFFNKYSSRILIALKLVKLQRIEKIFYGNPYNTIEFSIIENYAKTLGILENSIIPIGEVLNTKEEMQRFHELLRNQQANCNEVLLITNTQHMRRALGLFHNKNKENNIQVEHISVKILQRNSFLPHANSIDEFYNIIYEISGFIGYWLLGDIG